MSLIVSLALAQAPSESWKVIETEHYRVHYPSPAEEWTLRAVERMEATRERVVEEVGWEPSFKVQVVVQDPYSEANGAVLPMGRSPRMLLWTNPPGADSVIGHYGDWGDLLVTHEDTHVVHLLKPPRALSGKLLYELFKVAPITVKSPRWVIEGYATVVEGRLTAWGRPHGAYRATLLRTLAQQGQLPQYGELSFSQKWQGMGYAYLVGSAYLEWLEDRAGEGSLQKLWTRMTSRHERDFNEAFEGVYGDKPWTLYRRFCAELTADAMASDGAAWDRSTLWRDTRGSTEPPALSPDGEKLAVVTRVDDDPAMLSVFETQVNDKAVERRKERIAELLENDPEDAAPVDPKHAPHAQVTRYQSKTHPPRTVRWLDNRRLLFDSGDFDGDSRYRRDLWTFDVETNAVKRVTRRADVRDADPHPDGTHAVAIRSVYGKTGLVRVDLESGDVTPLTDAAVDTIVDQPRYSDDGDLLYLRHQGAGFLPVVRRDGVESVLELPPRAVVIHAAWEGSQVVASLAIDGRIDLYRQRADGWDRVTDNGAAFGPEPGEGGVFYLQMQADGLEIHFQPDGPVVPLPEPAGLAGPAPAIEADVPEARPVEVRDWGLGRLEPRVLVGGMTGQAASNFELGVRVGDIVGRNEFVLAGALGDQGGTTGAGLWWANRTLPADLEMRSWFVQDGFTGPWFVGGSAALSDEGGNSTVWGAWELGGWLEAPTEGPARGETWAAGTLTVVEPRTRIFRTWIGTGLSAGQRDSQSASMALFQGGFALGSTWELGSQYSLGLAGGTPFSLGGVRSGLRDEPAQWRDLQNGWLAPDTAQGTVHDRMEFSFGSAGIETYFERRRIWTAFGVEPYSLAGFRIVQNVDAQSLVKIPGVDIEIGIGCAFEERVLQEKACRDINHYRSWTRLLWRP